MFVFDRGEQLTSLRTLKSLGKFNVKSLGLDFYIRVRRVYGIDELHLNLPHELACKNGHGWRV